MSKALFYNRRFVKGYDCNGVLVVTYILYPWGWAGFCEYLAPDNPVNRNSSCVKEPTLRVMEEGFSVSTKDRCPKGMIQLLYPQVVRFKAGRY